MDVFTASDALERKPTFSASAMGCSPTARKVNDNNMHDEKDTDRERKKKKKREKKKENDEYVYNIWPMRSMRPMRPMRCFVGPL